MASSGFLVFNRNEDDEISQGHQKTLILCVGELTDIVWASHLLCGRVCCGRVCLWANSLVTLQGRIYRGFSGSLQGYQVSKITDLRDNSDWRYCEKTQFHIRGLRAPETVPRLALWPSRKVIPGFRISGS